MISSVLLAQQPVRGPLNRARPLARARARVVEGNARFTILAPELIRLEWSPNGEFEDRASLAFINRWMPLPEYRKRRVNGELVLETDALTLHYRPDGKPFNKDNLFIEFKVSGKRQRWQPGMEDRGNLGGTVRTLDNVSGACSLEPGLLSRDGWTLVDDSRTPLLRGDDPPTAAARANPEAIDWYFFGFGHKYKKALLYYMQLGGRIPLPPRYAFGSWWSRYWAYSDADLRQLVKEFDEHDVPLDVLVVDMDWHLDGWTGYTWNPDYFPDPEAFLQWAHDQGLHVTLNLHPADGVGRHEAAFADVAAAMELDAASTERIP
ncbi:MAG: TIM-barrel domain-containing protein, partial [Phycisphaerae bacterium]